MQRVIVLSLALAGCASKPVASLENDKRHCQRAASILKVSEPNLNEAEYVEMCLVAMRPAASR